MTGAEGGKRPASTAILRLPEVKARTGKGTTAIYAEMKAGTFPRQVPIGFRSVGWLESEVDEWITERASQRSHRQAA